MPTVIQGSVGEGGANHAKDVAGVQRMLNIAAKARLAENGKCDATTVRAIRDFQSRASLVQDGRVDPKGRTIQRLIELSKRSMSQSPHLFSSAMSTWTSASDHVSIGIAELMKLLHRSPEHQLVREHGPVTARAGGPPRQLSLDKHSAIAAGGLRRFPFPTLPRKSWRKEECNGEGRYFGASRGTRLHAGCDLLYPLRALIYAVADGKVVRLTPPGGFYLGTSALEVDHDAFVVRYGEISNEALVGEGDTVKVGQPIARVGQLAGMNFSMLHFEMYKGDLGDVKHHPLSTNGNAYRRRDDLIDPTPFLSEWSKGLPAYTGAGLV